MATRNRGKGRAFVTDKSLAGIDQVISQAGTSDVQDVRNRYLNSTAASRKDATPGDYVGSESVLKMGPSVLKKKSPDIASIKAQAKALMAKYQDPAITNITTHKLWFIEFMHVPSGETVKFDGFLTQFSDQFSSDWNREEILGRMDPIMTFKGTKRSISLGWEIPAWSNEGALMNLGNANTLIKFLYPVYRRVSYQTMVKSTGRADSKKRNARIKKTVTNSRSFLKKQTYGKSTYMVASPLFKVKFTNLICDSRGDITAGVQESGLVGVIDGFNFDPDLEAGFLGDKPGLLLPKVIRFQCNFTVLHTHKMGWAHCAGKYFGLPDNFPYSIESTPGAKKKRVQARIAKQVKQQAIFDAKRKKALEQSRLADPPGWSKGRASGGRGFGQHGSGFGRGGSGAGGVGGSGGGAGGAGGVGALKGKHIAGKGKRAKGRFNELLGKPCPDGFKRDPIGRCAPINVILVPAKKKQKATKVQKIHTPLKDSAGNVLTKEGLKEWNKQKEKLKNQKTQKKPKPKPDLGPQIPITKPKPGPKPKKPKPKTQQGPQIPITKPKPGIIGGGSGTGVGGKKGDKKPDPKGTKKPKKKITGISTPGGPKAKNQDDARTSAKQKKALKDQKERKEKERKGKERKEKEKMRQQKEEAARLAREADKRSKDAERKGKGPNTKSGTGPVSGRNQGNSARRKDPNCPRGYTPHWSEKDKKYICVKEHKIGNITRNPKWGGWGSRSRADAFCKRMYNKSYAIKGSAYNCSCYGVSSKGRYSQRAVIPPAAGTY